MAARHRLDIYDVDLDLATTRREWANLRRRLTFLKDCPDSAGLCWFAVWTPNRGKGVAQPHLVFWLDRENLDVSGELEWVETIAHEAAHGASQVLHWTGHDFRGTDGSDEPHAYLAGWLARWLWEARTAS